MMKKKELRCIHRHTIKTHPNCFAKGLVNNRYKSEREFVKSTGKNWWEYPEYKIGFLDIESDGFQADFSTMLSWVIKEKGGGYSYDTIDRNDLFNLKFDQKLVASLVSELGKYRVIVTYYGLGFDLPFIRAKALHYNIPFPNYGDIYSFDLYYLAKRLLKISRKSLDNVCDYLGIDGKTHIDKEMWRRAKYGDPKALAVVLDHNLHDCDITEQLYDRLLGQSKWTRRSI